MPKMEVWFAWITSQLDDQRLAGVEGVFQLADEILLANDLGYATLDDFQLLVERWEHFWSLPCVPTPDIPLGVAFGDFLAPIILPLATADAE